MNTTIRTLLFLVSAVLLILTVGFFTQASWATRLWPWEVGRLSYLFIASIAAAIGMPIFWIAASQSTRAAIPGAANLVIMSAGMGSSFFVFSKEDAGLLTYGGVAIILLVINTAVILWAWRAPQRDQRPIPPLLKISLLVFGLALFWPGLSMVLQKPVMPWPVDGNSSVIFGWIFLATILYFLFPLVEPTMEMATGQLIGFLIYDLVLIVPFLLHLPNVVPELRVNLIIYIGVLIYSGGLSFFYLFLGKETRLRFQA